MTFSIRNIMVSLFGVLTLVIFGMMGALLVQSTMTLQKYSQLSELAEFDKVLFDALMAMRSERGMISPAMKQDPATAAAAQADTTAKRQASDTAFTAAKDLSERIAADALRAASAPIFADFSRWQAYRAELDAQFAMPVEARNAKVGQDAVDLGAKILADVDKVALSADATIAALDPSMTMLTQIRSLAWSARSIAGTGNTSIVNALASNESATPENLAALDVVDAKVGMAWQTITNLIANPDTPPRILELYRAAEGAYFGGAFAQQREAALEKFAAGQPAGIAVEDWRTHATPAQGSLASMSSESLLFMTEVANEQLNGARLAIALYGLAAILTTALCVLGIMTIVRRVANPIAALTACMDRLAGGNHDTVVPGAARKDEIGEMSRAVEVFRQNGIRIAALSADEAERSQVLASRAEMMGRLQSELKAVVSAASAGDFTQRVPGDFGLPELNDLGASVNGLVQTIDRGLEETGTVLAALAASDLTRRVEGQYQGAFERLKTDTNDVAEQLSQTISALRDTSRTLKTATTEILSGANDLSERTTKQAATIEETSAAMEHLAQTVINNAGKADAASVKANAVSRSAEEGGKVMDQANAAMERITTSSSKISNIIGMIDDIAFQTNLLALNASVEAARAGEAGKGFAVVAVEVRRLAQSAASASSDVKALIEQSAIEVRDGTKLVVSASSKLTAMLDAIRETNTLMDSIAGDSRDQASAIEEVSTAVRQMDEMTQHNAALVEEINAAIEQTETQASELDRVVDIFVLTESTTRRPAAASAPASKATGIRGLQQKAKAAATYLSQGNAALKNDWSEF